MSKIVLICVSCSGEQGFGKKMRTTKVSSQNPPSHQSAGIAIKVRVCVCVCVYMCENPEFQNLGPQKLGTPEASDLPIDGASDLAIDGASDKMDIHKPSISGLLRA